MSQDPRFVDPLYTSGYVDGISNEQERIIRLIEDNTRTMTSPLDSTVMRSLRMSSTELIALIKGDK
jgi:transcription termination factor NusB